MENNDNDIDNPCHLRCNKDVPVMPDPDVPTDAPAPGVQCYSCGYQKKTEDSEMEQLGGDVPFCNGEPCLSFKM